MKPYRTTAPVRLYTGFIGLTDDQVKWRTDCLNKISDNVYAITGEVVFKAGEIIGLDDVPKPHRKKLECLEPEPAQVVEKKPVVKDEIKAEIKPAAPKKRGRKPAKTKA